MIRTNDTLNTSQRVVAKATAGYGSRGKIYGNGATGTCIADRINAIPTVYDVVSAAAVDCIITVAALRRGVSDSLALRSPRRHFGARERKTLLCRVGRRSARVDPLSVVPSDEDAIV